MPRLNDTLQGSIQGFFPAPDRPSLPTPVISPSKAGNFSPNPSIRCPLPPFNIGPDTLRQFDQSDGVSPKRRVIPLPMQTALTGSTTTVNNTTVLTSSGSGTSSALTAKAVLYSSPLLSPGQSDLQVITMAKSYQLISVIATAICEMRLYGDLNSQAGDVGRLTDAPLPAELKNNLVTDIVFDTPPYSWTWQNRVGVNNDNPQDTNAFITVFNTDVVSSQIQITILFLPLES